MAPGRGSNQQLSDEELARKLQAELNDGFAADGDASQEYHLSHRSRNTTSASTPKEIARNSGESANPSAALALRPKPQGNLPGQVEADIEVLQQFYAQLTSTRCYRCQSSIARDFDAKKHLGTWSNAMAGNGASGVTKSVCAVMCSKADCRASTCLGCGRKPTVGVNTMSTKTGYLDWCCDVGRLFAIWIFLARYDQVELKMQETEASKAAEKVRNLAFAGSNRHQRQDQKGKGYVSNAGFDDIFAMLDESRMYGQRSVRAINFQSADTLTDDVLGQLLTLTSLLLPSRSRQPGSGFDKEPPSTLNAALRLGLLVDKVAQLLRNDSIADITKRSPVYFPALQFVKILVSHRSTSDLVTQERYYKRGTSGLQVLSAPGVAGDIKGKGKATPQQLVVLGEAKDGNAPAVIKRLENLVKQSQIMLGFGRAEGTRRELGSETDQITMRLCETIVKVYDRIGCATPGTIGDTGDMSLTKGRGARKVKSWSEFHREKCFDLTEAVFDQYHFNKNLDLLHSPKGRIPYLMKEMASMSTSLPEGVFVKASSEIPGMMKCLILGPDDTPYEGGLFEFDIGAASNYPEQPPAVFFRGTHSARADMNPNLHVDGKVCLSLLGTFDGPPESKWQARKSTILSVLVSIQGMILTDEPWRNEPGNGSAYNRTALAHCRQYSLERMALTVRYAILPWLLDPSWRKSIWADIVATHFRIHADKILARVKKWATVSPGIQSFREQSSMSLEYGVMTYGGKGGRDLLKELEKALKNI